MTSIPEELSAFLCSTFGRVTDVQTLSGVARDGGAMRLQLNGGKSVIVKSSPLPRERNFYERHASRIRSAGVGLPSLYWSGADDTGRHWIAIEDVPNPFPRERWVCDAEQMEILFRLHVSTWGNRRLKLDEHAFKPAWDDALTVEACAWFGGGLERNDMASRLLKLQRDAQVLFQPTCCILADPNPTNWRIRNDGKLVLIDWERFCYGHPAIDLAITMPGLGSKDGTMEGNIAELYRECWEKNVGSVPQELFDLERWIRVAKLWSAVEFLANARRNPESYSEQTMARLVRELPGYVDGLSMV
ncbi:phosphotransferase [Alicyclobacillus macrosporangiidus]|uniref:phosphotransferase n=1 Tax=Alicyclobacillus macrosporangiidus TaxID=392015 RepID=UPI00054E7CAF|nr:phosphotransferase [Alicyclobacillus macrosporangiidus]